MTTVLGLADVRRADAPRVGGKAAVLGELRAAGFPIPDGLCLTTDAFRLALAGRRDGVASVLRDLAPLDAARAERAAALIGEVLADLRLPDQMVARLADGLAALGAHDRPVSVRSSATAEDRADQSFAGQYVSVLGARGVEAVERAVLDVWRSFFSASALIARGAGDADDAMAVLIQPVVDAECSGVCFTIDPVRQQADLALVEAAWGLGPGTVDAAVASDAYWVLRSNFSTEDRRVAEKAERIGLDDGHGLTRLPVADERRRAAVLPEPWLRRVVQVAFLAEGLLGAPQDVEWAVEGERLWVLQSRPITTLPPHLSAVPPFPVEWPGDAERGRMWSLDWVSRKRPLQPLEIDLSSAWEKGSHLISLWRGATERGTVMHVRGRAYFASVPTSMHPGDRRVRERAADDLAARLRTAGQTPWQHYSPEVLKTIARLDEAAAALDRSDGAKLAEHLEDAHAAFARHWTVHWLIFESEKLFEPLHDAVAAATGQPKEDAGELAAKLIEGEETRLTRLIDALHDLGALARGLPPVAALLNASQEALAGQPLADSLPAAAAAVEVDPAPGSGALTPAGLAERLAALPEAAAFRERLEAVLDEFGHRFGAGFGSEISFHMPSWREDPRRVLALAAPYLDPAVPSPRARREQARAERDAWLERLCQQCADTARAEELRRQVAYGRQLATDLEEHNHYIDQVTFGQFRQALAPATRWLVERGVVAREDDVFWLRLDELLGALRAEAPPPLLDCVAERRAEHARWARETPRPVIGTPNPTLDKRPPLKDELAESTPPGARQLKGMAASPGRHRGQARVVEMSVVLPAVEPGDVLVADNAGPQWTPLFPILGAIVLDGGALTQHAATTAREYGLPCVIRTRNATRRIPDRAWVVVDGAAGTVEVEEAAD